MASFNDIPNELLEPIAQAIIPGAGLTFAERNYARHADFGRLAAFVRTCRRFYAAGNSILYAKAAARHPYLLAWAVETHNMAVVTRLLDAGMNPNTLFYCRTGRTKHRHIWPRDPSLGGDPAQLFRKRWLRSDAALSKVAASTNNRTIQRHGLRYVVCVDRGNMGFRPRTAFPLHFAAANGHLDMIRALLAAGAFVDVRGDQFCCHRHWERHRISNESWSFPGGNHIGWTPLHVALCAGQDEAFWALRAAGGATLEMLEGYDSALHHAMQLGRRRIVQRLLDDIKTKADANGRDQHGKSLFWMAYQSKDVAAMRRLAKLGADINDEDTSLYYTPLFDACLFAKVDMVRELLQLGAATDTVFRVADVSTHNWNGIVIEGSTPLNVFGYIKGFTPLDVCAWLTDSPPKDKLVEAGYWKLPDNDGITLEELKGVGRELVGMLLDAGAQIERTVILAAKKHRMQALEALMPHPEFGRYVEAHGVGGILRAMVGDEGRYRCRSGEAESAGPEADDDVHFAELEGLFREHGLLKQGEHLDWEEARRLKAGRV